MVRIQTPEQSFAKATELQANANRQAQTGKRKQASANRQAQIKKGRCKLESMYYCYILLSSKSHIFYFGSTIDLKTRLNLHNNGRVESTKPYIPWKLVWYCAFETEKEARDFEQYLKTGSGKAFAYKGFVSVALRKDFTKGRKGITKL